MIKSHSQLEQYIKNTPGIVLLDTNILKHTLPRTKGNYHVKNHYDMNHTIAHSVISSWNTRIVNERYQDMQLS